MRSMKSGKNCESIRLDLFSFIHGDLDEERGQEVRRHLETCPACSTERESLGQVLRSLDRHLHSIEPAKDGWDRLASRIASATSLRRLEVRIAAGLIALFGASCLAWLLVINDQVVGALRETLAERGVELSWLTEGPVSAFLAPILFIALCSLMTLVLTPMLLREKKPSSLPRERTEPHTE